MKARTKKFGTRAVAMLLSAVTAFSLFPVSAGAAQVNSYHDPAEHWMQASGRTNELDVNAVVTHETFNCGVCGKATSFQAFRIPEYTRDGQTAMNRNVKYSDGTMVGGSGTGTILDGVPGQNASYTGYHWTKAVCEICGTVNSNMSINDYGFGKNVYWLYDCDSKFMQELPEQKNYDYVDSTYHKVTTTGGEYCAFCYGTNHTKSSVLERHDMEKEILSQPANGRFAIVEKCKDCDYAKYEYVGAKSVVASYYGVVDGAPHTISVTDLSDAGVRTEIRYGNSADSCTMTSAPNYTDKGQYDVYYQITYTYQGVEMTENGVANVWLHDETTKDDGKCSCGCSDPNCGCEDKNCGGNCCTDKGCGEKHHFTLLDSVKAGCKTLGYDRYLCTACGKIEKRDYVDSLGHVWQSVKIREATCEADGKQLELCSRCGEMKETATPKGEHKFETHSVAATCTNPGYTVRECSICGERHIEDITATLAHKYEDHVIPATCEYGGKTIHRCDGCGSAFVTDYTEPLGHSWDKGTLVTNATCTGEGVMEYHCVRCGEHKIEGNAAAGHVPGSAATCTEPQLCTKCGAVLNKALGHDYKTEITKPTCTEMGYTMMTCTRCGDSSKTDYTKATGHKPGDWIIDKQPTADSEGSKHKECTECGEKLDTQPIEKIYNSGMTDSKGQAVVGGYLVTVTDTEDKTPVSNASVVLNKDNSISIRLPNSRLLDYGYQSFAEGEVTAETAHAIGVELAEELWGERFEVVIATHCNTGHYHNHFVINSVSWADGYKFNNSKSDYAEMRKISDRLCREHAISVIDVPSGKGKHYAQWSAEKNGKPTYRSMIRADINRAIRASTTERDFIRIMQEMGYELKTRGKSGEPLKYPAIKPPDAKGYFRFHKLGEEYSLDAIKDRILDNISKQYPFPAVEHHAPRKYRVRGNMRRSVTGLQALYFRYCYELHILVKHPTSVKRVSFLLKEDVTKLDRLDAQTRLLARNHIRTGEDLSAYQSNVEAAVQALVGKRHELRNELKCVKRRNGVDDAVKAQIKDLTAEIRAKRKEVVLCSEIAKRSEQVREKLERLNKQKKLERKERDEHELFGRRGRTGRENVAGRG